MPFDVVHLRTRHEKMHTSKRISGYERQFCRQGDIDKSRCPQCTFSLGTAFFSHFFLVVNMGFCESQAVVFSPCEAPLLSHRWLFFIRDSHQTWLVSANWWSQQSSKKPFSRIVTIRVKNHLHNVFYEFHNTIFSRTTLMFSMCTFIFRQLPWTQNPFFAKTLCACDKTLPHVRFVIRFGL